MQLKLWSLSTFLLHTGVSAGCMLGTNEYCLLPWYWSAKYYDPVPSYYILVQWRCAAVLLPRFHQCGRFGWRDRWTCLVSTTSTRLPATCTWHITGSLTAVVWISVLVQFISSPNGWVSWLMISRSSNRISNISVTRATSSAQSRSVKASSPRVTPVHHAVTLNYCNVKCRWNVFDVTVLLKYLLLIIIIIIIIINRL